VPAGANSLDAQVLVESLVVFLQSGLLTESLVLAHEALRRNRLLTEPLLLCGDATSGSC